jgi:mRNA-degrading endonuclease YafQ of YafQ-DinJ toxin-antitoxin module
MRNISKIVFTDLFWDTLKEHRKHARYPEFRAAISNCIRHKAMDRSFTSNSDQPFVSNPVLKGVWHCKLSRTPDIILFYRIEDETMYCAMIGDHHDYGLNGKNLLAGKKTATKINGSIDKGHVAIPGWEHARWSTPDDLLKIVDLHQVAPKTLDRLMSEVLEETRTLNRLKQLHGDLNDLPEETFFGWVETLEFASDKISAVQMDQTRMLREHREYTPVSFSMGG